MVAAASMEPYAAAKVIAIRDCMLTWHTGCSSRDMLVHNAEKGAIRQTFILPVNGGEPGLLTANVQEDPWTYHRTVAWL